MIILIIILICLAYIPIYFDENYFPFTQCIFLLIFQYGVSYFPFIIITSLLPDIGIFVVLLLHWIFSMSISIIPIHSQEEFKILIRSFFLIGSLFLLIGTVMYIKFIKSIMIEIYQK